MDQYEIIYKKRGLNEDFRVDAENILDAIYKCYEVNSSCIVEIIQIRVCN